MNVVLYARSATGSTDTQLNELRDACRMSGYRVLMEFVDENTSANVPLAERPQGKAIISFCRDSVHPVDGVMVVRRDRISRSAEAYMEFADRMRENQIRVITTSDIAVSPSFYRSATHLHKR